MLRHILTNLLANALKYSPSGGTVHFFNFSSKNRNFSNQRFRHWYPKSGFLKLFQPFHRAENTDKIPGTGLGLAIVKKCVEVYGGQISVQSEIGIGSVFTAILPLQDFSND